MPTQEDSRFWEIDAVRGLAVIAMVVFHILWDLWYLGLSCMDVRLGKWYLVTNTIGSVFIFVLGISVSLKYRRELARGHIPLIRALKRSLVLLGCALIVSFFTFCFLGNAWVRFGILHHAAVATILASCIVRLPIPFILILGLDVFAIWFALEKWIGAPVWLTPFGVLSGEATTDYYPLVPWFGVALLGVAFGKKAYGENGARRFPCSEWGQSNLVFLLCWLGRNSLVIYLVHQPILIATLQTMIKLGMVRGSVCRYSLALLSPEWAWWR